MRRHYSLAAAGFVVALLVAGTLLLRQRQAAAARLAQWQAERDEDAIPAVLSRAFEWERGSLTLGEFADLVAAKSGLVVEIDEKEIAAKRRGRQEPRDIKVQIPRRGNFSLQVVLRMVLGQPGLGTDLRGQRLTITTPANSREHTRLRTGVYPLPQLASKGLDEAAWAQIVAGNINGHVEAVPGAILVVANAAGHRRARLVLDTVRGLNAATAGPVAIPPVPLGPAEKQILAALDEPAKLDVVEMPLKDVVLHLGERQGIPLILLADKLEEASVSIDTPITKSLRDVSLRSALHLMLKDLELTYVLRDEAVVITTPEDAEEHVRTLAYPVRDLAKVDEGLFDAESLAELVEACIAPDKWGAHSGPPTIRQLGDAWLIFEQTDEVHDQVADLLAAMRRILTSENQVDVQSIGSRTEPDGKIRAALESSIELDFQDVPLKDVVLHLQKLLNVPIVLSLKKLDEAGISADTPITIKLPARRAWEQLERLLKEAELDFVIRDEVVQITTPEDSESQLSTRVYDTRQLIAKRMSADDLSKLIESTVQPTSWDNAGGPGCLEVYRDLLVVSHTTRVHEQIQKLLMTLAGLPRGELPTGTEANR